jgi:hypothetical protein
MVVSVVVAATASAGAGQAVAPSTPTFATSVAWSGGRHGEPSITVAGEQIYVAEPAVGDVLYHSSDGGVTFDHRQLKTGGSGDSDVAVDADGIVYVSDLFGAGPSAGKILPVVTSLDHGQTFSRYAGSAKTGNFDRQWTVAEGHGHVVNAVRNTGAGGIVAYVSRDAARTFTGPHTIDPAGTMGGPLVISPDGTQIYMAYDAGTDLRIARSVDGGDTWATQHVADLGAAAIRGFNSLLFPVAAVDELGIVSVVWVTGDPKFPTGPVWFTRSLDGGQTWSDKVAASDTKSVVMPWVVARNGHVAIAWYQSFDQFGDRGPELGSADTTWDIVMAQSFDAASATPAFVRSTLAFNVHRGSICTTGTGCVGPGSFGYVNAPLPFNRQVLDFFEIALDGAGGLFAVYPVDRPLYGRNAGLDDVVYANSDLTVARQTGGSTL